MAKYPNQKTIILNYAPADESNYYAKINSSALTRATKTLTHKALLLWLYLSNRNYNTESWDLSLEDVLKVSNMGKTSYYGGVKELIGHGYLIDCGNNKYNFYQIPKENNALTTVQENPVAKPKEKVININEFKF